ncbi:single-stranded-DNA-specific exonuclease RecJ [Algisphaera agarilytica]|uniref:Single-stranded-DNA-specific exonuclease RecJ n=1 Tax=Algisphaera agarilytica TaxID=1385975 RepID=A0A7X0H9A2_9BACT|nr:DHHA1 domain-containing protein [Algisphaera agarilytica]MBB6430210.1 single-stranded-DNA-specific exonuclease [Algisphaera agarilytica]
MLTAGTRKRWVFRDVADGVETLDAKDAGGHPLLARLLALRNIATPDDAQRFLSPKLNHLDDPADLPGCAAAATRIAQAVRDQQPILIYGDYDVDGVTASAILWHTLKTLGHEHVATYVPHRLDEGYGLNAEAFSSMTDSEWRKANGLGEGDQLPLVISVDCGITAVDVAAHAKSLGIELIITDHHEFDADDLPDAVALVHPELGGISDLGFGISGKADDANVSEHESPKPQNPNPKSPSPLCGAGVAFKLAWQTARTFHNADRLPAELQNLMCDLLAFAALGTIADIVPLVGENRVITVHGLSRIKHTNFLGLNALIDAAELRAEKVDAYHVGFVLGPRLNACGRMGHAKQAVTLLTNASPAQARELAGFLTKENDRRKNTECRIVDQAKAMVEEQGHAAEDRRAIVLAHEDWHPGVIGIVASRLVETYHRPAVLLGIDTEKNEAKGSARSIDAVNLHAAISEKAAAHCTRFGGHAMAAGLSLEPDKLDAFRDDLIESVNAVLPAEGLIPTVKIDAELALCDCALQLFHRLESLAPFGRSNPKPRLLVRGAITARAAQRMGGEGKHLSVSLRDDQGTGLRAVGFGLGDLADDLPAGIAVDVVFQPKTNTWRGVTSPELHLVDIRPAESD